MNKNNTSFQFRMVFISQTMLTEILILAGCVMIVIILYFHNAYKYWSKKGIPTLPPRFPLGNSNILLPKGFTVGITSKTYYDYLKQHGYKFGGIYLVTEPNLVIVDPDIIKDILSKDFQYFVDRGFYFNEKDDPISANLFALDGAQWKKLRAKLTPTFSSSKMKMMFPMIVKCAESMTEMLSQNVNLEVDVKEMMSSFTIDVIGLCAFGIDCNSLKNPNAEFRKIAKRIFAFDFWRSFRAFFIGNSPKFSRLLRLRLNNRDVCNFFVKLVTESIEIRKEAQVKRNDFLQILIDLGDSASFSVNELAAQAFLFFLGGFDSSSITMTFILYELAKNTNYQNKLREEIGSILAKCDNQITYENIYEMKYLGRIFDETLRLYPTGTTLRRRCVKEYKIRNTDVAVEKGTPILISAFGLHRDPEYFPDPEKFNPDRFTDDQKRARHPYVYLPFGEGPRNCIGFRFGMMQTKIAIVSVINNFQVAVSPKMKPVRLDPSTFSLRTIDQIYLKFRRIQK